MHYGYYSLVKLFSKVNICMPMQEGRQDALSRMVKIFILLKFLDRWSLSIMSYNNFRLSEWEWQLMSQRGHPGQGLVSFERIIFLHEDVPLFEAMTTTVIVAFSHSPNALALNGFKATECTGCCGKLSFPLTT